MRAPLLLLLFASCCSALRVSVPVAPTLRQPGRCRLLRCAEQDDEELRAEMLDSDEASAARGPKILMPPVESLGLMPDEATSFSSYLAPYAALVLGAFALASGAFALLVLQG